jgi:hypothetical protein
LTIPRQISARPPRDRGAAAGLSWTSRECAPPHRNLGPLAVSRVARSDGSGWWAVARELLCEVMEVGRCSRVVAPDEVLGMLIRAQRPTVTIALQRLARAGLLVRERTDRWLLTNHAIGRVGHPESLALIEAEQLEQLA